MKAGIFRVKPNNHLEALYLLTTISLAFLSWIPSFEEPATYFFALSFSLSISAWFVAKLRSRTISKEEIVTLSLIFFLLINSINVAVGAVDFFSWIRSAVPIVVLLYFLFARELLKHSSLEYVLNIILLSFFVWLLALLFPFDSRVYSIFSSWQRITGIENNFIVPYPFLILILIVFFYKISFKSQVLLLVSSALVVLVGYKMQIAWLLLLIPAYVHRLKKERSLSVFFIPLVMIFFFVISAPYLLEYLSQRYSSLGGKGDDVRLFEIRNAWEIFKNNPLLGNGLGTEFLKAEGSQKTKTYIHNSLLYTMATMGMVGAFWYIAFFSMLFFNKISKAKLSLQAAIFILLTTTLTAASFKLIHFNYFISILMACVSSIKYNRDSKKRFSEGAKC